MKRIRLICLMALLSVFFSKAQELQLSGKVYTDDNVENVHVINITSKHFTITDSEGNFQVLAKIKDTINFTSIQHKTKQVIVDEKIIKSQKLEVYLEEQVTEIDEVFLGKILLGDLSSDIKTVEEKPDLNFWDVGIPGYKGKPKTQSERRLNEATTGAGIVPLNPILNAISGRTKMLKKRIKLESQNELLNEIISSLANDFFSVYPLEESKRMDFFYFCSEDPDFETRCKGKNDVEVFEYLKEKYHEYQNNSNEIKN